MGENTSRPSDAQQKRSSDGPPASTQQYGQRSSGDAGSLPSCSYPPVTGAFPADLACPVVPGGPRGIEGEPWFRATCTNTQTHVKIHKIERILAESPISPEASTKLLDEVLDFKGPVPPAYCPLLCARLITVVKRLAFVEAPEDLYGKLFGAVLETWENGLRCDRIYQEQYGEKYAPVFDSSRFLQHWSEDLVHVRRAALSPYAGFLRFRDVHVASAQFDTALEGFVKHVQSALTAEDWALAGKVALNFVYEVLGPLLKPSLAKALKHTKAAASLISKAALLNPGQTLGDDTKPVLAAMTGLEWHIRESGVPRLREERTDPKKGSELKATYEVLNVLHRKLPLEYRPLIEHKYSTLIPWAGGWDWRRPRLAGSGWRANVSYTVAGQERRIPGRVIDFCPKGRGCQIKFDSPVEDCLPLLDAQGGEIPGCTIKFKGQGGGSHVSLTEVTIAFERSDGSAFECAARALRGWRYERAYKEPTEDGGAAFEIDNSEDVQVLRARIVGLLQKRGMEPLAPVLPGPSEAIVSFPETARLTKPTLKSGPAGILETLREFCHDLQKRIRVDRLYGALWDNDRPFPERAIHANLWNWLHPYFEERGGLTVDEATTGAGRCDFLILRGDDRVAVELKPSYGDWRQGMKRQLQAHTESLKLDHAAAGLFLVFAFQGTFKAGSQELQQLHRLRDDVCADRNVRIDIAVINCDPPESASKGHGPLRAGQGFYYSEWSTAPDSPAVPAGVSSVETLQPDARPDELENTEGRGPQSDWPRRNRRRVELIRRQVDGDLAPESPETRELAELQREADERLEADDRKMLEQLRPLEEQARGFLPEGENGQDGSEHL